MTFILTHLPLIGNVLVAVIVIVSAAVVYRDIKALTQLVNDLREEFTIMQLAMGGREDPPQGYMAESSGSNDDVDDTLTHGEQDPTQSQFQTRLTSLEDRVQIEDITDNVSHVVNQGGIDLDGVN